MLVLRVEYLTGVCMATRHNDPTRSTPEWPPHPDRLYSALVAAAAEPKPLGGTDLPAGAKETLEWLAEQGAPLLHASPAHRRTTPAVPMPSNPHEDEVWQKPKKNRPRSPQKAFDLWTLLPVHRMKVLLPIPAVVPEEPAVYFAWPDAEPDGHRDTLHAICERVTYLGRSRSLVRVSVEDAAPPATHVPDPLGGVQLRVPGKKGRLAYLIDKHQRDGGKPEPSPPRRYRHIDGSPPRSASLHSVFNRFWVFQPLRDDPALPIAATLKVTQALRRAVLEQVHGAACGCDRWQDRVPSWREAQECFAKIPCTLSGHAPNGGPLEAPHLAFVALPFVHPVLRHADGAVKGLAVLVPRDVDCDASALTMLARGLRRLEREGLRIPGAGIWHLKEVPPDDPPLATLDSRTWTEPSRTWTTATPMVFGHFPKPKNGGEAKVVLDALRLAGIDPSSVVEIAVGRHSPLHGAPPSWCFKTQRDRAEREKPRHWIRHVTIQFDRTVSGPLALGCLRYFGLGFMRPLEG
ncbi:MAG: type I-U CRISPR-associated protein Cas5/Cas6 [Planctomycetes bacterium]|nr:type I-U CRISPR-associated protein Cas5/Cas6 [Planctomycetota bacterium]